MHNIEKSQTMKGLYIGYGGGAVWRIRNYGSKSAPRWQATPQGNNAHQIFSEKSLKAVSERLESLNSSTTRKTNPAPRKYRGKYPRRIVTTASAGKGIYFFQLNDGSTHHVATRDLLAAGYTHEAPHGVDFDEVMRRVNAVKKGGAEVDYLEHAKSVKRKTNPAKRRKSAAPSGRVGLTRKQYVTRPSQASGHRAPSKRLQTRRKKALAAPGGYFPNPLEAGISSGKADRTQHLPFHVQQRFKNGVWHSIASFEDKADAFTYAKKISRENPEFTLRVMKDE